MKVTLIRPQLGAGYDSPARLEPLALAVLAALTPPDVQVVAVDERFQPVPFGQRTDLVALSVCTFSALRAYEIAAGFRARGVPVVMGGFHPTLCPEEALQHADSIACGDAESLWPQMLADFAAGRLQRVYRPETPGPDEAVIPDRSVLAPRGYLPLKLVQLGRGCHLACEFCAVRAFYGGRVRHRSVDAVVSELRDTHARRVFFVDDNLLSSRAVLMELLEAIVPLRVRWSAQVDLSIADDPDLLALAVRSGCQSLTIGFESLDERNLSRMGKGWSRAADYRRGLRRLREAGVMVYGTFVFGYDHDGPQSFRRTVEFAIAERLFIANFNPLQPLPGTRLYRRLRTEGRLRHERWWLDPGYRWHEALLQPRSMTPEQLTAGCTWARRRFHSAGSMLRRFGGSAAHWRSADNAGVFWAANLVSRLDIRAKSGLRLGTGARPADPGGRETCASCS